MIFLRCWEISLTLYLTDHEIDMACGTPCSFQRALTWCGGGIVQGQFGANLRLWLTKSAHANGITEH